MPLVPLSNVLDMARRRRGYAVGMVCLSWEDAEAFVAAGSDAEIPVILSAGPGARAHIPIPVWGAMFTELGRDATVPVVAHLDHGQSLAECQAALAAGFTSVMFDGSDRPIGENIDMTRSVVTAARAVGASVEAEVGVVGYDGGLRSSGTDPAEARALAALQIDALAVSLGNVHLQTEAMAEIDWVLADAVARSVSKPLVIHGGSGVATADRARLARDYGVAKINIGTEMRQVYGQALRALLAADPDVYDRLGIARAVRPVLINTATGLLRAGWNAGADGA